jgi:hypothetical protein
LIPPKRPTHIPNVNIADLTHDRFLELQLPDRFGLQKSWLEIYYETVYPRIPIISREIITKYFYDLPISIIHSMFSCCYHYQTRNFPLFQQHHQFSLNNVETSLDEPDLFIIISLLHACQYLKDNHRNIKSISYLAMAVRISHVLQIHITNEIPIYSHRDKSIQLNMELSKQATTSCVAFLYINDFYCCVIHNMPFLILQELNSHQLQQYDSFIENIEEYYNFNLVIFYSLYIWCL